MHKAILIILLLCAPVFATDWYADSGGGNMSTRGWHATSAGSCTTGSGTALTWASRAAGDVFHANACTAIAVDVDPGANGKVTLSTVTGTGAAGGAFTCATATGPATINADVIAGTSTALAISGSSGSGCNVTGNSTGGTAGTAISSSHTVVTITLTGNCTGGTAGTSHGCSWSGASGALTVTGSCTSGTSSSSSMGCLISGAGNATVQGDCIGNDSQVGSFGCEATSTGTLTAQGKLVYGKKGAPIVGNFLYVPGATSAYLLAPKDASYTTGTVDTHATELPSDPGVANVRNGTTYGTFTGTASLGSNSGSAN